ncbi:MAG: zinc-binding dehydrogenase [Alphaproteobacteria bacterium]|nr:zinc-binding dehydrogenase [Alphaproteobacteria bacterium]
MVKAIRFHEFGGPEVLKFEDIDIGDPGPGEVRLRHTAIGFNFLDALVREGKYPVLPELPAVPGAEAAGVIEAVGEGVDGFEVGQRVAYASGFSGAYAEARLIDASVVVALPDAISDEDAAASLLKGMTVEYLVNRCYPVNVGEYALVHAAAGGVGLYMCQWLKSLGVTVIGTTTSEDKKDLILANGGAHAVNSRTENITELAREVTGGEGVHVVYDSVGPAVWSASIEALRPRGYYVNFGNASGVLEPIDAIELQMHGSLFFTKASMRYYHLTRQEVDNAAAALFDVMASGAVKPVIGQRYALTDAAQAQIDVMERRTSGSTVLTL